MDKKLLHRNSDNGIVSGALKFEYVPILDVSALYDPKKGISTKRTVTRRREDLRVGIEGRWPDYERMVFLGEHGQ